MKLKYSGLIICNTTPLLYLHQLNLLTIIKEICGDIVVPPAVIRELKAGADQGVSVPDIGQYNWVTVKEPVAVSAHNLIKDLGDGETEVLMLALEMPGSLVILDDNLARTYAYMNSIHVIGTCGLLVKAKYCGLIPSVTPVLELLEQKGFFISKEFRKTVISLARE